MEKTNKTPFVMFKNPPSVAGEQGESHLPVFSGISGHDTEREIQIPTVQISLRNLCSAPFFSTLIRDEHNTSGNHNSGSKYKCSECGKEFRTDKALYGHTRIHQGKGTEGSKKTSNTKKKPKPDAVPAPGILTVQWKGTKRRIHKTRAHYAACTLILLSKDKRSWDECSKKKRKTDEPAQMDEKQYDVGETSNRASTSQKMTTKKTQSGPHSCDSKEGLPD